MFTNFSLSNFTSLINCVHRISINFPDQRWQPHRKPKVTSLVIALKKVLINSCIAGQFVKFIITNSSNDQLIEKKYSTSLSLDDLKMRLEMLSGIDSNCMVIEYYVDKQKVATIGDNVDNIQSFAEPYLHQSEHRLHLIDLAERDNLSDRLDQVPKFELSDEEYAKRSESLRQFKMQHKLGRFSGDHVASDEQQWSLLEDLNVGDKVEVLVKGKPNRQAIVMYKGEMHLKPGPWVGVNYLNSDGKHDGSIDGRRYFDCQPNHGAFVRPFDVRTLQN